MLDVGWVTSFICEECVLCRLSQSTFARAFHCHPRKVMIVIIVVMIVMIVVILLVVILISSDSNNCSKN